MLSHGQQARLVRRALVDVNGDGRALRAGRGLCRPEAGGRREFFLLEQRSPAPPDQKDREAVPVANGSDLRRVVARHFFAALSRPTATTHATAQGDRCRQLSEKFDRWAEEFCGRGGEPILEPAPDRARSEVEQ